MNPRLTMNNSIKNIIVPHLREHGFKGSFPHFRRKHPTHIDLITFQFNRYGGSFIVELTTSPIVSVVDCFGEQIPFNKLTAHDISIRHRLSTGQNVKQPWFDYEVCTNEQQFDAIAYTIKTLLKIENPNCIPQLLLHN